MGLVELGGALPAPISQFGGKVYLKMEQVFKQNRIKYHYKGEKIDFRYTSLKELFHFRDAMEGEEIGPEGVPMEIFDLDGHDAIIDVGAYFGAYSVLFGVLNPDVDLICFEPNEKNRAVLTRNLRENDIDASVRSELVAGETKTVEFYREKGSKTSNSDTMVPDDTAQLELVEREAISLGDLFVEQGIQSPFVKIDAEGAEQDILPDLLGCQELDHLSGIIEFHDERLDREVEDYLSGLGENGYETELVKETPTNRQAFYFHPRNR